MNARLERVVRQTLDDRFSSDADLAAAIVAAVLDELHESRTITTTEQLDALPFLAVVREVYGPSPSGCDYGGVWERRLMSGWHALSGPPFPPAATSPRLPARLLWNPSWTEER